MRDVEEESCLYVWLDDSFLMFVYLLRVGVSQGGEIYSHGSERGVDMPQSR